MEYLWMEYGILMDGVVILLIFFIVACWVGCFEEKLSRANELLIRIVCDIVDAIKK